MSRAGHHRDSLCACARACVVYYPGGKLEGRKCRSRPAHQSNREAEKRGGSRSKGPPTERVFPQPHLNIPLATPRRRHSSAARRTSPHRHAASARRTRSVASQTRRRDATCKGVKVSSKRRGKFTNVQVQFQRQRPTAEQGLQRPPTRRPAGCCRLVAKPDAVLHNTSIGRNPFVHRIQHAHGAPPSAPPPRAPPPPPRPFPSARSPRSAGSIRACGPPRGTARAEPARTVRPGGDMRVLVCVCVCSCVRESLGVHESAHMLQVCVWRAHVRICAW